MAHHHTRVHSTKHTTQMCSRDHSSSQHTQSVLIVAPFHCYCSRHRDTPLSFNRTSPATKRQPLTSTINVLRSGPRFTPPAQDSHWCSATETVVNELLLHRQVRHETHHCRANVRAWTHLQCQDQCTQQTHTTTTLAVSNWGGSCFAP